MRRADRLFQILRLLRRQKLTTAAQLAKRLEVSERTIYRDVADLCKSGIPIEGEAGVGYVLSDQVDLPPLMFDAQEIQALVLGARMVETWGDEELRSAARSALSKVEFVLPCKKRELIENTALFAASYRFPENSTKHMSRVRRAIEQQLILEVDYVDAKGENTQRRLRCLGLYFWGPTWTLAAYCELRQDFRVFRMDRMQRAKLTSDQFALAPPITLADFARRYRQE